MKWLAIAASIAFVSAFAGSVRGGASPAAAHSQGSASSSTVPRSKTPVKKHRRRREPTQKAPTSDRITEIQSALARNGCYEGDPNGKWDVSTIAALRKFQAANELESTGKIDALSLQKLGLGSSIAGVSAPRPAHLPGSISNAPVSSAPPVSQQPAKTPANSSAGAPSASNSPLPIADPKPNKL